MILLEHLPFETDLGPTPAGRVGVITLASDYTIEAEMQWLLGHVPGLGLFCNRIHNDDLITPETLRAMETRLSSTAADILLGGQLDVIAFGCTSASMAIGEERVFERIREARPGVACTTPITAAFAAFGAFGAKRIAMLTPYRADVNEIVADYVRARGFEIPIFGSFNEPSDAAVATISPPSVAEAVERLVAHCHVDAVFVSCTSVRLASTVADLEARIGLPVTSSNHAMAWHAMRLTGIDTALPQLGRLYGLQAATQKCG